MTKVFVAGVGMTPFGRHLDKSLYDLSGAAIAEALQDAGLSPADVGAAYYAGATNGPLQGQTCVPGPIALRRAGFSGIPVFSVENACASGSSAFNLAVQAIQAGTCEIAIAVGCEKMNVPDKAKMFAVFDGGWDVSTVEQNKATLLALGAGVTPPPGTVSERPYSVFMDVYAALTRAHMKRYGTTQRQIAAVAAKNHQHSVHNPLAQYRDPMTIEQVLAAPPITYPLTMPMCSPISDGAAAVIVCAESALKRLADARRAVQVLASVIRIGSDRNPEESDKIVAHLAARQAYEIAGVAPAEVNVAEVHDATAMGEILNAESLMLAPFGEGGPAAERGDFTIGGRCPVNPSGGLESKGHPIGATGLGQIFELVTQLRGEAGARQVEGARIAAHENGGGLYGIEEAVVAVNLFGRR
ncbi:thiolase family protein [Pseudomonas sp. N040]|uniref:thiolase family protein n=1 Tax=Pseudomonas sp. N040 TaxID=2785325 RepID=UPI0018A288FA|nr:thiolase family protein [Pseudomonas sp. N040]MBF7729200.1 thiolase family protein [Pseudomonas sp. N040]MBW7012840.1 thiolase family protein [Pseudomonas sp. N040]